ncbi:phosphotransferase enzyme family-domain-containing protein [Coprinopsis sp. MPI-PUGE-AT-0042]|nr:phosphotransferase enzyme family-domain-containing protein [Coprinopsis sp. MPI-PUGE-AT-0042]
MQELEKQPFWNAAGERQVIDPPPLHYMTWTKADGWVTADGKEVLDGPETQTEKKTLEGMKALKDGCEVVEARFLASSVNTTALVRLSDEQEYILRMTDLRYSGQETIPDTESLWRKRKFDGEIGIMQLLIESSVNGASIPSPRVRASHVDSDQGVAYAIFEKLPGMPIINVWGSMKESSKAAAVTSYAKIMTEIFRLPLPGVDPQSSQIGSLVPELSGKLRMGPRIFLPELSPLTVHDGLDEFIDQYIALAIKEHQDAIHGDEDSDMIKSSQNTLERLRVLLRRLSTALPQDQPHLWRPVLSHDDLRSTNILVDPSSGAVTGIIDWEYHSVLPAVLVAEYPEWLSYTGQNNPRFASSWTLWHGDAEECAMYRGEYERLVLAKDPEYHDCLVRGALLREGISWVKVEAPGDPGRVRLGKWLDSIDHDLATVVL